MTVPSDVAVLLVAEALCAVPTGEELAEPDEWEDAQHGDEEDFGEEEAWVPVGRKTEPSLVVHHRWISVRACGSAGSAACSDAGDILVDEGDGEQRACVLSRRWATVRWRRGMAQAD